MTAIQGNAILKNAFQNRQESYIFALMYACACLCMYVKICELTWRLLAINGNIKVITLFGFRSINLCMRIKFLAYFLVYQQGFAGFCGFHTCNNNDSN